MILVKSQSDPELIGAVNHERIAAAADALEQFLCHEQDPVSSSLETMSTANIVVALLNELKDALEPYRQLRKQ